MQWVVGRVSSALQLELRADVLERSPEMDRSSQIKPNCEMIYNISHGPKAHP